MFQRRKDLGFTDKPEHPLKFDSSKEKPMPKGMPARDPLAPWCKACNEKLRFFTNTFGQALQECRCGVMLVPVKRPASFERYTSGSLLAAELETRVAKQCALAGEAPIGRPKRHNYQPFYLRKEQKEL